MSKSDEEILLMKKLKIIIVFFILTLNNSYSQQNQWMIFNTSNSSIPTNNISDVAIDKENNIWFVPPKYPPTDTGLGIIKFDFNTWEIINQTPGGIRLTYTRTITADLENRIWFVGFDPYNPFWAFWGYKNGDWIYYNSENSPIPSTLLNCVTVDSNNNKWMVFPYDFGTDYIGKLEEDSIWTIWTTDLSIIMSPYTLRLTAVDSVNNLWIGGSSGLIKFDGVVQTFYPIPPPIGQYPEQLVIDKQGVIWLIGGGTWDHLIKFENGVFTHYFSIKGQCGAVDDNNNLWIGSTNELLKYDGVTWTTINSANSSLPENDHISSIDVDNFGNLVIGLISVNNQPNTGGLVVYNPEGIIIPVELKSFTIDQIEDFIKIKWSTATELNNSGFKLFRNEEFVSFITGNGTTTEPQDYEYIDKPSKSGRYMYELFQIDFDGEKTRVAGESIDFILLPHSYLLSQNYPNPFNPSTKIKFTIAKSPLPGGDRRGGLQLVKLVVYDILGNEVTTLVNEEKPAGEYEVEFNAKGLPSGIYFYRLIAGSYSSTKKMILLR